MSDTLIAVGACRVLGLRAPYRPTIVTGPNPNDPNKPPKHDQQPPPPPSASARPLAPVPQSRSRPVRAAPRQAMAEQPPPKSTFLVMLRGW